MGKKMGVRGRPGLFFVIILVIFLAIFFMTWKSMITPKRKTEVRDIYSMNLESMKQIGKTAEKQQHSDLHNIWHREKLLNGENTEEHENERDKDYDFKNSANQNKFQSDSTTGKIQSPLSDLLHASQHPVVKQEIKPYYMKPNEAMKIIGGRMERFVHLDLKGAAPKISYFKEVFPLFSRLGATGLLIEYEDMFPYTGKLEMISAENSYTKDQIKEILDIAKLNSLQVIPLIQTFGHMEFVLKSLHLKGLRETEYTPQVIDISSNASYELIQNMVKQILEAHPAVSYLHIGCDEVYELGKGKSADIMIKEKINPEKVFLRHVKRVAGIVADLSKSKVRPIMWDDELRKISGDDIVSAGLPSAVDIMVWRYQQNISDVLTEDIWKKYGQLFKSVWAASSFKGATGPRQMFTEPLHHIVNHFSWMNTISKYGRYVSFKGIALTGWQRFDHFATLCDLLPVAIPSLAVCLATVKNGGFNEEIHKTTSSLLGCSGLIEMGFPQLDKKERKALVSQDCRFPGHMVYYAVQQLWGYKQFEEQDRKSGWLSDYQIKRGFTNPGQLKVLSMRLFTLHSNLVHVREPLEQQLLQIYTKDTVEEWMEENIVEMQKQISEVQDKIKTLLKNTYWARRPNLPLITKLPRVNNSANNTLNLAKSNNQNIESTGLQDQIVKSGFKRDIISNSKPGNHQSENREPSAGKPQFVTMKTHSVLNQGIKLTDKEYNRNKQDIYKPISRKFSEIISQRDSSNRENNQHDKKFPWSDKYQSNDRLSLREKNLGTSGHVAVKPIVKNDGYVFKKKSFDETAAALPSNTLDQKSERKKPEFNNMGKPDNRIPMNIDKQNSNNNDIGLDKNRLNLQNEEYAYHKRDDIKNAKTVMKLTEDDSGRKGTDIQNKASNQGYVIPNSKDIFLSNSKNDDVFKNNAKLVEKNDDNSKMNDGGADSKVLLHNMANKNLHENNKSFDKIEIVDDEEKDLEDNKNLEDFDEQNRRFNPLVNGEKVRSFDMFANNKKQNDRRDYQRI